MKGVWAASLAAEIRRPLRQDWRPASLAAMTVWLLRWLVLQVPQNYLIKLTVQSGTEIDLTTSGSMLAAGKTRSGKTTGIIALLLQALLQGRDKYGSES